jgi:nucleotide-binding universal stress UspA family protein
MAMKTLLLPIEDERHVPPLIATAHLLARRFDSYIEGIDAFPAHAALLAADAAAIATLPRHSLQEGHRQRQLRARFERALEAKGIGAADGSLGSLSCGWCETITEGDSAIAARARLFDLTIVARPSHASMSPRVGLLETIVFESGRPILIAPPEAPQRIGHQVLIAWNGSTESARAIALAMPLLEQAAGVVVLSVEGAMFRGPSGDEVAAHMAANGIKAHADSVPGDRAVAGRVLLAEAEARGCDLIVKGAYTQSRLRQMVFGGVTSHIIWHTEIPVFLAH